VSRRLLCLGLFAAWALHDAEEVLTASWWSARVDLDPRLESTTPQFALAAAVVGVAVLAAAVRGARTGGRSVFFRAALLVFGWHGVVHIGQALLLRDYVPGLVTAVVLVIPYSIWAWRRLHADPVPGKIIAGTAAAAVVLTAAAQGLAKLLVN
jgi:hypothetical protein